MNLQLAATQPEDRLFIEPEMCDYLRIRPRQRYSWRIQGLIPYIKIGKAVRFRKSEVDAALDRLRVAS